MNQNKSLIVPLALFIILAVIGWGGFLSTRSELGAARQKAATEAWNYKVLNFTSLFINAVLGAQGEVDFETRLLLENSVRDIGDKEILGQWRAFVDSQDEASAQQEVKKLMALLISRIQLAAGEAE